MASQSRLGWREGRPGSRLRALRDASQWPALPMGRGWRQGIVVGVVLLLSAYLAQRPSPVALLATGSAILGLGAVLGLLRWPHLGLPALIPVNMFVAFSLGTGTGSAINATILLVALLLVLWIFEVVARRQPVHLPSSRATRVVLLLVLVTFLAFLNGQVPWFGTRSAPMAAQIGGLGVVLISAAGFLLAAYRSGGVRWLERLTWLFVILSAVFVAARLVPFLYRPVGSRFLWGSTSNQFWTWLMAILLSQILFNRQLSRFWRGWLSFLLAGAFYAAFVQTYDWTSGWLPPLAAIVALITLRSWRLGVLLGLVGLVLVPPALRSILSVEAYSYGTRLDAWVLLLNMIRANPILGFGPANYYSYTTLFPIRGYAVQFNSHSQYIDLILQTGIVGLLVYLSFLWEIGRLAWRLRERVGNGFARAYLYGALGGLSGMVVAGFLGDWLLPFVYNVGIVGVRSSILAWIFLGGVVALRSVAGTDPDGSGRAPGGALTSGARASPLRPIARDRPAQPMPRSTPRPPALTPIQLKGVHNDR